MAAIAADIKKGTIARVYLFYGEEAFKRRYYKELLKEAVTKGNLMNFASFEGKDINWQAVYDMTQTMPFLAERRLVFIENSGKFGAAGGTKEAKEPLSDGRPADEKNASLLEQIIQQLPESTCLAFFEDKAAKNKKIFKAIASSGVVCECQADTEEDLINWLARGFAREGKKIRRSTLELMIGRAGLQYDRLRTEFEKVVSYAGDKEVIEDGDILAITTETAESRIFDMLDAISTKNVQKVLSKYQDLLANREHPLYILSMLRSQFRTMLQVAELTDQGLSAQEAARAAGKPVFVVNKTKRYLRCFSNRQIEEILEEIAETDRKSKSGEIQDQIGVELMLIRFSSSSS